MKFNPYCMTQRSLWGVSFLGRGTEFGLGLVPVSVHSLLTIARVTTEYLALESLMLRQLGNQGPHFLAILGVFNFQVRQVAPLPPRCWVFCTDWSDFSCNCRSVRFVCWIT